MPASMTFGRGSLDLDMATVKYYAVTVSLLLLTFIIAMSVTELGVVIELIGATGSTLIGYVLPGLLYLCVFDSDHQSSPNGVSNERFDSAERGVESNSAANPLTVNKVSATAEGTTAGTPVAPAWLKDNDGERGLRLGPSKRSFWPVDPVVLRRMAWMQFILGIIIMPTSLVFIFSTQ
jgi:hypothetical protein